MIIGIVILLTMLVLPRLAYNPAKPERIKCVNNLKNIGLAFRIFATDHGDRFPMQIPISNGGSKELSNDPTLVWFHFAAISNELTDPRLLLCPKDILARKEARTFERRRTNTGLVKFAENSNLSYFVGLDTDETKPQMLHVGDRNITNSMPTRFTYGTAQVGPLGTNHTQIATAGWDQNVHKHAGNILLGDGSVQQFTTSRLREHLRSTGDTNGNRIAVSD